MVQEDDRLDDRVHSLQARGGADLRGRVPAIGTDVFRADGGGLGHPDGSRLMLIALLALPALLRFVAPMTGAGGGGTPRMALGAAGGGAGGELASGAVRRAVRAATVRSVAAAESSARPVARPAVVGGRPTPALRHRQVLVEAARRRLAAAVPLQVAERRPVAQLQVVPRPRLALLHQS